MSRYVKQLKRLLERHGEDTSLGEALEREMDTQPGEPGAPRKALRAAYDSYRMVQLAIEYGYKETPACRLIAKVWRNGDFDEEFVRNRYRRGREHLESLMLKDRAAFLRR